MTCRSLSLTAVVLLAASWTRLALADRAKPSSSSFAVEPAVEASVLTISLAVWAIPALFDNELFEAEPEKFFPDDVNAVDRTVIGNHNDGARIASDVGVVVIPTLALGASLLDVRQFGWSGFGEDALLMAESIACAGALHSIVSHAYARPRPYMYANDPEAAGKKRNADDFRSFFSGHTAVAFSAATSFATIFSLRHESPLPRLLVWIVSIAGASTVGILRISAGKHFPTDVLGGALVGTGAGMLIPFLHYRKPSRLPGSAELVVTADRIGLSVRF